MFKEWAQGHSNLAQQAIKVWNELEKEDEDWEDSNIEEDTEKDSDKRSITGELEKLVEMKEKGLLTDQEFDEAKQKLLS